MKERSKEDRAEQAETLAQKAESGEEVSEHFTGRRVAKQRVNVDFTLDMLEQIDAECRRLGITRQAWIKYTCDQQLREVAKDFWRRRTAS